MHLVCGLKKSGVAVRGWLVAKQGCKLNGWELERNRGDLRPDSKSVSFSLSMLTFVGFLFWTQFCPSYCRTDSFVEILILHVWQL